MAGTMAGVGGPEEVAYVGGKWGGGPHYSGTVYVLGDDDLGTWLWGPCGRTVSRGSQVAFRTDQDLVALLPVHGWWSATWWLGHPEVELYVNIQTPAERAAGVIRYIDLDLDVVRLVDGTCEIVDQDEFEAHQVELGYPAQVVEATARTASHVLGAVRRGAPPFDGAAARHWAERARAQALPVPPSPPQALCQPPPWSGRVPGP